MSYRTGEMIGRREADEEWSVVDSGFFTVTNKQVVFRGDEENIAIPLRWIVGADALSAAELAIQSKRRKTVRFSFPGGVREVVDALGKTSGSRPVGADAGEALAVD